MLDNIYNNETYKSAIADANTTGIAYKFNGKEVTIISTRSTDSLLSKIYYVFQYFFGRYTNINLDLERERDAPSEIILAGRRQEKAVLEAEVGELKAEKARLVSEIRNTVDLSNSRIELKAKVEELGELLGKQALVRDSINIEIKEFKTKLADLNQQHWENVKSFLDGKEPVQYLNWLSARIEKLEIVFTKTEEWIAEEEKKGLRGQPEYIQRLKLVLDIRTRIQERIDTQEKKLFVLSKVRAIKLSEHVIKTLEELVELNFRLQQINQL